MSISILLQFITNTPDNLNQIVLNILDILDIIILFLSNNYVIITSILIGILSFLFFTTVIQSRLILRLRKKHFITTNTPTTAKKSTLFKNKQLFWKKIPVLSNFYTTYQWANLPFTYEFFLTIGVTLFFIVFIFSIALSSFLTAIFTAIFLTYLYFFVVKMLASRNYKRISNQLPFTLETLASSMQSGHSLVQALKFTAKEVDIPLKLIFDDILTQINYNIPLAKVFTNTQKTIANQEFKMLLDGLIMQNKMGGDIIKMLKQMATWIRQKNKLQRDIKVFTSQGRLSGIIIMLLWPLSATIFYFLNANYITILFDSNIGKMFLILSLFLEILGFIMIWKIIKIKI